MANLEPLKEGVSSSSTMTLEKFRVRLPQRDLLREGEPEDQDKNLYACLNNPNEGDDGFFYVPDFLSENEERYLLEKINSAPQPKWKTLAARRLQYWGGQLSSKQTLIPEPMPDFLIKFPEVISRVKRTGAFRESKHGEPNHCLVNEYHAGQGIMPHEDGSAYFPAVATVSLGSHTLLDIYRYAPEQVKPVANETDSPNMSSTARAREPTPRFSILQERRSLLITRGSAYKAFLHGIAERERDVKRDLKHVINDGMLKDSKVKAAMREAKGAHNEDASPPLLPLSRETRISLTLRDVEKVSKGLGGLLGKRA